MKITRLIRPAAGRLWEVDLLRGIAVIMMIAFHAAFDLGYFAGYSVVLSSGFWWLLARATATIFVLLAGISLALSHSRARSKLKPSQITIKYLKRGLRIFCWGLLITLATWLFLPQGTIWFGVLHLIGLSIILAMPLLKHKMASLVSGIIITLTGIYLSSLTFDIPWLLPIGMQPADFYTFDYLPLLPWLGVFLIGLFLGSALMPNGRRLYRFRDKMPKAVSPLCFIGRHSLFIYFIHQFVLVGIIFLVF